jgi:signal transduction histidine kinase
MTTRQSRAAPVRLLALFVVLAGLPLAALGWLGWRLLDQDRALETQRLQERLDSAAAVLAHELDSSLAKWDALLATAAQDSSSALPPDAAFLVFDADGLLQHRGVPLPYYPVVPAPLEPSAAVFAVAEAQEWRGDLADAAASYRSLASTKDRRVRAAALVRLARCLRNQRQFKQALTAYGDLAAMGETPVFGSPAELLAHHERVALFKTIGDEDGRAREAAWLASALAQGQFPIDRPTFDDYRTSASQPPPAKAALELAEAVYELWPLWQKQTTGRAASTGDERAFAAVWRRTSTGTGAGTAVLIGGLDTLTVSALVAMDRLQVRLVLEDAAGRVSFSPGGALPAEGVRVARTVRETGLPWTMRLAAADPAATRAAVAGRRNLWSAAFGLMVLVILGASYVAFRAVNRELRVARLQSDFVATVSHEFRTPLTAMRHLTEMLEEGSAEAGRLPHYYRALGKETRRLHTMVESLLDFGRMEAGHRIYQMEDTSASEFAQGVVDEFCSRDATAARRVELQTAPDQAGEAPRGHIRADRDALALALRNLLDNAVKYSPESSTVRVSVEARGALTGISVEDHGAGMSAQEQRDVFRKFIRGTAATLLNVKGTGIGLAMADQIVKAHGGRLELASEPGRGSRFTIWLPGV